MNDIIQQNKEAAESYLTDQEINDLVLPVFIEFKRDLDKLWSQ
jgi:hypothetical protein